MKRHLGSLVKAGYRFPPTYLYENSKRNLASLARNGQLPRAYYYGFANNKRDDDVYDDYDGHFGNEESTTKRHLGSIARGGYKFMGRPYRYKRHLGALARGGGLPAIWRHKKDDEEPRELIYSPEEVDKRNLAALARGGHMPSFLIGAQHKRNDETQEKDLTENADNVDKRHLGSLARSGNLPLIVKDTEVKKNDEDISAEVETDDDDDDVEKRHIGSLAKSNHLPWFWNYRAQKKDNSDEVSDEEKSEFETPDKKHIGSLARFNNLPSVWNKEQRIIETPDKKHIGSLARFNNLPSVWNKQQGIMETPDKKHIGSLAKSGYWPYGKRSMEEQDAAETPPENVFRQKRNIASQYGGFPFGQVYTKDVDVFYPENLETTKRTIASLARLGGWWPKRLLSYHGRDYTGNRNKYDK